MRLFSLMRCREQASVSSISGCYANNITSIIYRTPDRHNGDDKETGRSRGFLVNVVSGLLVSLSPDLLLCVPWAYWYAVATALIADCASGDAEVRCDCRDRPTLLE